MEQNQQQNQEQQQEQWQERIQGNQSNEPILHENGYYYSIIPLKINNETVIPVKIFHTSDAKRLEGEHYFEYRTRKNIVAKRIKEYRKGTVIWDTNKLGTLTLEKAQRLYSEHIKQETLKQAQTISENQ
jgi:hypothetical protein